MIGNCQGRGGIRGWRLPWLLRGGKVNQTGNIGKRIGRLKNRHVKVCEFAEFNSAPSPKTGRVEEHLKQFSQTFTSQTSSVLICKESAALNCRERERERLRENERQREPRKTPPPSLHSVVLSTSEMNPPPSLLAKTKLKADNRPIVKIPQEPKIHDSNCHFGWKNKSNKGRGAEYGRGGSGRISISFDGWFSAR